MPLQPLMLQSPGICNFLILVHSLFLDLEILNMFFGTRQSWVSAVFRDDYWALYAVALAGWKSESASVLQNTFLLHQEGCLLTYFEGIKSAQCS